MINRILLTGSGGPAAVGVLETLHLPDIEFWAADMSPEASGLYLVPEERRLIVPRADHPDFVEQLLHICERRGIHTLWPTVDAEMIPVARARRKFEARGIELVLPDSAVLARVLDKWRLHQACSEHLPCPDTRLWEESSRSERMERAVLKPRRGSGSRGIHLLEPKEEAPGGLFDYLLQQELPGREYSVDTFVSRDGAVTCAVPRLRARVDSGVAVAAETFHDAELEHLAVKAMQTVGLTGVANVQFREDAQGDRFLLEINPRVAGTMVLSVRAGVPLFELAVKDALNLPLPVVSDFEEIAVIRRLTEQYVSIAELERMRGQAAGKHRSSIDDEEAA